MNRNFVYIYARSSSQPKTSRCTAVGLIRIIGKLLSAFCCFHLAAELLVDLVFIPCYNLKGLSSNRCLHQHADIEYGSRRRRSHITALIGCCIKISISIFSHCLAAQRESQSTVTRCSVTKVAEFLVCGRRQANRESIRTPQAIVLSPSYPYLPLEQYQTRIQYCPA